MTRKRTRHALISSVISLVLCCSMLIGTTFAWFTDEVTSENNIIKSGNLDVELYYQNDRTSDWTEVTSTTNVFKQNTLWEPGHTEVVKLKVVNAGTLALKYQLGVNVYSETGSINKAGDPFKLSDYIKFAIIDGEQAYDTSAQAVEAAEKPEAKATALRTAYQSDSIKLYPKEAVTADKTMDKVVTMVVYMPTTVGNEANYAKNATVPQINLGLNLFATQLTSEEDSYGPDYDKDAPWTGGVDTNWYNGTDTEFVLMTAEQLAGVAKIVNSGTDTFKGKTLKMGADMDLNNVNWTPIGSNSSKFEGTFKGAGKTIYNLKAVGTKAVGLFGKTFVGAHIEDLNVDGAFVSGEDYVGVILGQGYLAANCIKNCTVQNATVIATPVLLADGTYDGGAKAGVIAGQAYNGSLIGNTVKDSTVTAYRDLGAVAGMLDFDGKNGKVVASDNTVDNVTLNYIGVLGSYADGKVNENRAAVVGRVGSKATVENNTVGTVTENDSVIMISTLDQLIAFAKDVNGGNTYKGKTVMLGANIDLCNMEWTPIGNSTNQFKGTFDGNKKTISNLSITGNNSNVGLFGDTRDGAVMNLTVENAKVSGRLNVGVVAGNPYTAEYSNITVKGHVEVNGMAYVGGVGGKNAYADWTDITVNADDTSYVKANSVENGTAYRTYVGGVVGFNGEGGHTFKNITSNIDVIGSTCDVGGVFGIAHYGNTFENITCTGNVTITDAAEAADAEEIGGIAGVWNNGGADVTFTDCSFTGKLTANITEGVDLTNNTITGAPYSATGTGRLIIDGKCVWPAKQPWDGTADTSWYDPSNPQESYKIDTAEQLAGLAELVSGDTTFKGVTFTLTNDVDLYCEDTTEFADGDPLTFRPIGDKSKNGTFEGVFDGNGYTISNLYQNGWDLGYEWGKYGTYGLFGNINNATVKNLTITGAESYIEGGDVAGITGSATGTCVFENITITDSDFGTYNNGNGGIIGWSGAGHYTFKNITIAEDVTLAGLWGSFDSSIGGIVGQAEPGATYTFENVDVACRIDAYNDCTASYDYYNYRMCGMLIGRLEETTTIDGANYPDTSKYNITCNDVTVTYGDWANYHYCRAEGKRAARVEAGYSYGGIAADYDHSVCTAHHMELIPFDQIFGGDQYAVKGLKTYEGVEVIYNNK